MFQMPGFIWLIPLNPYFIDEETEAVRGQVIDGSERQSWFSIPKPVHITPLQLYHP